MRATILWTWIAAFCLAACNPAPAGVVSIVATADGDVRGARSGGLIPRSVDDDSISVGAQISGSLQDRAIWEFDLSGIAAQPISSATLDVTVFGSIAHPPPDSGDGSSRLRFYGYQGNGVIDTDDYAASGSALISTFVFPTATNGEPPSGTRLSFDLDTALLRQVADGGGFFGIRAQQSFNFSGFGVRSLEYTSSSGKPTLVLDVAAVPEPSNYVALSVLLSFVVLIRRKRVRCATSVFHNIRRPI